MRLNWHKVFPKAYDAMAELQKISDESRIDQKLLELVKIRASQINGCAHCLEMHTKDARAIGESEDRINLLAAWREAPYYNTRERAALAWCESLTLLPQSGAPDDLYEQIRGLFTPEEIVELTMTIITINSWNRLGVGFRTEVGGYVSQRKKVKSYK
jgi:AhpD family alkylhydroperoxidase